MARSREDRLAQRREHYAANRRRLLADKRAYYVKNREKILPKKRKEWGAGNTRRARLSACLSVDEYREFRAYAEIQGYSCSMIVRKIVLELIGAT